MQQAVNMHGRTQESAPRAASRLSRRIPWTAIAAVFLAWAVWWVATSGAFTSGDEIGYNLGLAGGILMLLLLIYPLRKRVRALDAIGPVKHWFSMHMALGIAGPVLILLHSRFELGSLNASIAFWSMVLVASSGVIGRFLYRRIHHGLYGRKASLQQIRARAGLGEGEARTWLKHLPAVVEVFDRFSAEADVVTRAGLSKPVAFFALGLKARIAARRARHTLESDLPMVAEGRRWDQATLERRQSKGRRLVDTYIGHVQEVAQFAAYERLFALWHVLHLPFVFMLFFSAVAHVLYVHMY
jgi:hypothetical protein